MQSLPRASTFHKPFTFTMSASNKIEDVWIPSVCYMCYNCCGILAHKVNGTVIKIEADPKNPANRGKICAKGNAAPMSLYNPLRVKVPLMRTNPVKGIGVDPQWKEIGYEEALNMVADRLKKIRGDDPRKLMITTFDLQAFDFVRAFATAFGTVNTSTGPAGFFCGNAFHPVTYLTMGTFFAEPDLEFCNYCILIGTQNGFVVNSAPMDMAQRMADARVERNMKLVVVDPVGTNASAKADEWLPIRPGTDAAFALALANQLVNELGIYDREFLTKFTNGPYLVGPDGRYLRGALDPKTVPLSIARTGRAVSSKSINVNLRLEPPLVWDKADGKAKPFNDPTLKEPALEGLYTVDGVEYRTAFEALRNHLKKYPAEWASEVTTIPADTIKRIAKEFGEAAQIGSTIRVQGKELPHRPVCVDWYKGAGAHKHSMHIGLSLQLLNILVGAIDVPGGFLGNCTVGPGYDWAPRESPEGLILPADDVVLCALPYPARKAQRPKTPELFELFPVAPYSRSVFVEGMLNGGKYGVPYELEMMINCRTNMVMGSGNPEMIVEALKKIKFIAVFANEMNEMAEMADIVIPDAHWMERLDPFVNQPNEYIRPGLDEWYFEFRQPIVEPPPNVKHWAENLLILADKADFLSDVYVVLNTTLHLKAPYELDPNRKYSYEEIADLWAKSRFGEEVGLEWFKKNAVLTLKKEVEEAYPRPFLKPRIPIYYEHFIDAGEDVKRVTMEMGLEWDISDYQPLPEWKPCPSFEQNNADLLYAVNFKLPTHTFTNTINNPWLAELSSLDPYSLNILINTDSARRRSLKDGDACWLEESIYGYKVMGKIKVTECIHPEVVAIAGTFGHWTKGQPIAKGKGVNFNTLLPPTMDRIDPLATALDSCVKVKAYKA